MKKYVAALGIGAALVLGACSDDSKEAVDNVEEEVDKDMEKVTDTMNEELGLEEGAEYGKLTDETMRSFVEEKVLEEGDVLNKSALEDGVIGVDVTLKEDSEDRAIAFYEKLANEALNYEGWNRLEVHYDNFDDTITIDRSEDVEDPTDDPNFAHDEIVKAFAK